MYFVIERNQGGWLILAIIAGAYAGAFIGTLLAKSLRLTIVRVLILPMWEKASNVVYDMLVGHEVGHALYTPNEDWSEKFSIPQQFVNVTEDARIEKLMKRRYAGLAKTFYGGYKELAEQDFFAVGDDDITTYNLADRANLWFKIGSHLKIDFSREEREIIDLIDSCETFGDVLLAAEQLYKFCKQRQEEELKINLDSHQQSGGNSPASDFADQKEGENDQPEIEGDSQGASEESQNRNEKKPESIEGGNTEEPEVKTVDQLAESIRELMNHNGIENVYLEVPELDLKKIVVPNSQIHQKCEEQWNSSIERGYSEQELFREVDKKYKEFKRSAQKEVNYLVKEFECRKAADSYARASTARTGVLDCSKLHTYKFNDDLFKKVTTLADGKNHGLVFILDWSGSMGNVMEDTIKQLYNLIWFCRKVSIPFEVYAFTTDYPFVDYDDNGKAHYRELAYKKRDGLLQVGEWFSLMNIFTSKVNTRQLEEQMVNIFRICHSFKYYSLYGIPHGMNLSGTPLNESIIALHQILPKFQRENKLQKVQCVILTDGEACPIKYHREIQRRWEQEPFMGTAHIGSNCILRDRKTGNTYNLDGEWYEMTDILLHNLRDKFLDTNFIGIRVLESRDATQFIRRYCGYYGDEFEKVNSSWKKEKAFSIKKSGYHTYFGLSANALAQDTQFEVSEDASKAQIKSAFVKSLKSKKMNKKILGEFVELVA